MIGRVDSFGLVSNSILYPSLTTLSIALSFTRRRHCPKARLRASTFVGLETRPANGRGEGPMEKNSAGG